jgi:flagellar hook-basal body complex protein FliE
LEFGLGMAISSITSAVAPKLEMPLTAQMMARLPSGQAPQQLDFGSLLGQGVSEVNSLQQQATASVHEMLTGGDVQPAEVFSSVQKADMAFRMLLQVRNKLMQAYEEVNAIRI